MKVIRKNVFETNSSTTHSLVMFDQIKACGLERDNSNDVTITLIPLYDDIFDGEETINQLNHVSYMVCYVYTRLMYSKYISVIDKELAENADRLIDKMQELLVELGYKIHYKEPLLFQNSDIRVEFNDGSDLEYLEDFEEILENTKSFNEYLTKYTWVIRYCG